MTAKVWENELQARRLPRSASRDGDHRNAYQRDKARVLHSAAFRRLQAKTQVLGVGLSDFYRTRLTHSLEAAQIGTGITAQLCGKFPDIADTLAIDANLIETLCLAHDIGHPPFGHGGEVALHYMMYEHGGFEGNGQTFRIITQLEPYTAEHGMNLCRRSILGLVKYPNFIDTLTNATTYKKRPSSLRQVKADDWHPPKGLFRCDEPLFDWLLAPFSEADKDTFMKVNVHTHKHKKTRFKSFDCSIMELADDIAYGIHDLEDAIVMGMVNKQDFTHMVSVPLANLAIKGLSDILPTLTDKLFSSLHHERKNAIGALVNSFITAIEIMQVEGFEHPLLAYNAKMPDKHHEALELFKQFVLKKVIRRPDVQLLEYKGQLVVMELFEAFSSDPERLLPENTQERWLKAQDTGNGMRVLSDYISGMTDEFASRLHGTLFSPKQGGVQDNFHV